MTVRSSQVLKETTDTKWRELMKKVLWLSHVFPRFRGDYAGNFLLELSEWLHAIDWEVTVVAPHAQGLPIRERMGPVNVVRFEYAEEGQEILAYRGDMHHQVLHGGITAKVRFFSFLRAMLRACRTELGSGRFSLVHAHWWVPAGLVSYATRWKAPYIITSHGTDTYLMDRFAYLKPVFREVLRKASFVTVVSEDMRKDLNSAGLEGGKSEVLSMAGNLELFRPTRIQTDESMILGVGRLVKQKGFHDLIQAIARLKRDVKLVLIGEGPERSSLMKLASELGVHLDALPFFPKEELCRYYNMASVVVLPSVTMHTGEKEGLGLVLVEALLCKRPVVGTSCGGIPDIIRHHETGLLVPERDPNALALALETLLENPLLAQALARRGYEEARTRFAPQRIARRFSLIYENALALD